jgi:peptidoglycan/LPS O-acetylase OafA/YrhL
MDAVKPRFRAHIDGLRAIAVLAVVGFHAFPAGLPGGFAGVDIFFVISGYLISTILYAEFAEPGSKGAAVISDFYSRRVRRIFPALIVALIAAYVLGLQAMLAPEFKYLCLHIVASTGFFVNILLSREAGYFEPFATTNPLIHIWSLAVEEQFYIVWPFVVWLVARLRIGYLKPAVFLAALSFFWNAHKSADIAGAAFFLPQMRMWELLIGSITAIVLPMAPGPGEGRAAPGSGRAPAGFAAVMAGAGAANLLSLAGIIAIFTSLLFMANNAFTPDGRTLLPTLGAALVVGSSESAWINRRLLSLRVLVWVGKISYPLYLWHWLLLSFSKLALDDAESTWVKTTAILASVVLAWLTYRLVERPIRYGGHRRWKVAFLVAAMAAVSAVGWRAYRYDGYPMRFPSMIQELSGVHYEPALEWREGTHFLLGSQNETHFPIDPGEISRDKPAMYLWGDSNAAALYPGINKVFGSKYNIVQRTASKLPPFIEGDFAERPDGERINHFILDSIIREKPACVVLGADWSAYEWQRVEKTVEALKAAGIRHIVLVGPVPQWEISLPHQLCRFYMKHKTEPLPVRMKTGLHLEPLLVDPLMAAFSERLGVEYISSCKLLENQDGYIVRLGDTVDSLVIFDAGHLTARGSIYLVSRFPDL